MTPAGMLRAEKRTGGGRELPRTEDGTAVHQHHSDEDKLTVLLRHWIEHNAAHGEEFGQWARRAETSGLPAVAGEIRVAGTLLDQATQHLKRALADLVH